MLHDSDDRAGQSATHPDPRWDHTDLDVTFYLQVYRDFTRADACLVQLRRHYPVSRVIVVSDGDPDPRFSAFIDRYAAEFHQGQQLYPLVHGGAIVARMLALWGPSSAFLFKIDPDTLVRRRFRWLPGEPLALFGHGTPAQGGCIGFTRAAGERLLRSGLLADDRLIRPAESWATLPDGSQNVDLLAMVASDGRVRTDWLIGWCCRELGIPQIWFPEVFSVWRDPVPTDLDVAVSHPHTDIPVEREVL